MKKIVLLFLLFVGTIAQAQSIEGYWQIETPESGTYILSAFRFHADGIFYYFTDNRPLIGSLNAIRGEYKVEGDKLILSSKEIRTSRNYIVDVLPFLWDWETYEGKSEVKQLSAGPFIFQIEKDKMPIKEYDGSEKMTDILRVDSIVFYRNTDINWYNESLDWYENM